MLWTIWDGGGGCTVLLASGVLVLQKVVSNSSINFNAGLLNAITYEG